jgi:NAD(P)H-flavin reductase/ferredoxin
MESMRASSSRQAMPTTDEMSSAVEPVDEGSETYVVTVAQTGRAFTARVGERLLGAARRSGVWVPFECGWGSCGTCKATVVEGDAELLFPAAPSFDERDVRRNRILLCQSIARSDLTIKPFRVSDEPRVDLATRDDVAELVKVEELGPSLNRFTFRLTAPAEYVEGQYASLQLGNGLWRCYSMQDLAGSDMVSFIAKRYEGGVGSSALFALEPGVRIDIELPYGGMWLKPSSAPVVLVAGGTGISPILAMVRRLVAEQDGRPVRVYYGAGSPAELVAWDELHDLISCLADGALVGVVVEGDDHWYGPTGFVTSALTDCVELAADADVYLAGPPPMVDAVLAVLKESNVGMNRICYDRFG